MSSWNKEQALEQAHENTEVMRKMLLEYGVLDPLPEPAKEPAPGKQPSAFSAWLKRASNPYPDYLYKPVKVDYSL